MRRPGRVRGYTALEGRCGCSVPPLWRTALQRRRRLVALSAVAVAAVQSCRPRGFASWSRPKVVFGSNFQGLEIPRGLRYCTDFVSEEEQAELLRVLDQGPWLGHIRKRAQQFFGLVYYHTSHDLAALQPASASGMQGRPLDALPAWLLPRVLATGVFESAEEINQVAANEYLGRAGIASHVEDTTCFGANLATLSLLAPVEITLTPADQQLSANGIDHGNWVKVLLEPRSYFVLQDESRFEYRHGIRRSKIVALRDGASISRSEDYRRISLTFRELLDTRRKLAWPDDEKAPPAPPECL